MVIETIEYVNFLLAADSSIKNVKPESLTKDVLKKGKSKLEVEKVIDRVKPNSRKSVQRSSLKVSILSLLIILNIVSFALNLL